MQLHHYQKVYDFMRESAHGDIYEIAHVERVVCNGIKIARTEKNTNLHIVVLACLLHDTGKGEPTEDHATSGSRKAYQYLVDNGYPEEAARQVEACILTHSYKAGRPPLSPEAKALFDADKLDLTGALGVARSIEHSVRIGEPIYTLASDGRNEVRPGSGKKDEPDSLLKEYRKKLKRLPDNLYTKTARKMARKNRRHLESFFKQLSRELRQTYTRSAALLPAQED